MRLITLAGLVILTIWLPTNARAAVSEAELLGRLLPALGYGEDLGDGLKFDEYERRHNEIVLRLHRLGRDGTRLEGSLSLTAPHPKERRTKSFGVLFHPAQMRPRPFPAELRQQDEQALAALIGAYQRLASHDDGSYEPLVGTADAPPGSAARRARVVRQLGIIFGGWVVLLLVLRRGWKIERHFRMNHLLPAILQAALYAYWALYYDGVRSRLPDILMQIAFAYVFEFCLSVTVERRWRASFGPLPIVLSTNLFVWYLEPELQVATVALAIASKALVRHHGRHLINPSAFGISVVAVLTLLWPNTFPWGTPTPGNQLNLPPNMAEIIVLLGLVAQSRFPVVLVTLSASWVALVYGRFDLQPPWPTWPATLLLLVLFATDPSTIPKTNAGRLLYGVFYGLCTTPLALLLRVTGNGADDYSKVLPIPVGNLLSPTFDAIGARAKALWQRLLPDEPTRAQVVAWAVAALVSGALPLPFVAWGAWIVVAAVIVQHLSPTPGRTLLPMEFARGWAARRWNNAHVLAWLVLFAVTFVGGNDKFWQFETFLHWKTATPGIVLDADGLPRCQSNPVFCTSFSLIDELRLVRSAPSHSPPAVARGDQ